METPSVEHRAFDEERGVQYRVMAYRKLTDSEVVTCIRMYLGQKRKRKPKKGDEITIITIIGYEG